MTVIILRPFFIYGPRQSPHMLIQRLVASVAAGRPVTLQGAQGLRINPLHVEDAARAFARALDLEESSTVNVAGSEVLTLREIATTIGKVVGREPIFEEVDAPPRHLVGDTKKMHQILCVPVVPFASGVLSLRDGSGARGTSGTTTRS
jgi:nucleoside-diphosphate-sugar epimerase